MDKRFVAAICLLLILTTAAVAPAAYQGDYALMIDGPTEVELNSTQQYTSRVYDPQGGLVSESTFSRTFTTAGFVTVRRQQTITQADGTRRTLNATLDVLVQSPDGGGAGDTAASTPEGVFFTNPAQPSSNVKDATVQLIESAQSEILMAAYTVESQEVADALIAAARRLGSGKVKLVVEERYYADPDNQALYNSLRSAGVQIVSDGSASGALMHNKFLVIDRETTLNGSTNFTNTQLSNDANNSVILNDPALADAFAKEFNEMYSGTFDGAKSDNTPHEFTVRIGDEEAGRINVNTADVNELASLPGVGVSTAQRIVSYRETNGAFQSVQGLDNVPGIGPATISRISSLVTTGSSRSVPVRLYFSPSDDVKNQLLDVINNARQTISFSIFTFTDPDIAGALEAAKARGVRVQGVFDAWQANGRASQYDDLLNAGLDVRKDGYSSLNHSKYLVADGSTVVTGSFNWTGSAAEDNDENLMILSDATIAGQYQSNFNQAYAAGH